LRNQQLQKQFMDYYFDKDKTKKEILSEEKQKLLDNKVTNSIQNGTTKYTTQNTLPKNAWPFFKKDKFFTLKISLR